MKIFGLFLLIFTPECAYGKTTVETLAGDARFSTLVKLVTDAGLVDTLNGGNFTIFAPTDYAFGLIGDVALKMLSSNSSVIRDILLYHVSAGRLRANVVHNDDRITMANGKDARLNYYAKTNKVTIDGKAIMEDMRASNGEIHVIDRVLMAPTVDMVGYLNIFADKYSTILGLVKQAGLLATLQQDNLTLFLPSNAAFAKMSQTQLTNIAADQNKLSAILTYHVVKSTVYTAGLYDNDKIVPLNTKDSLIVTMDQNIMVNSANVIGADISVTNGVIHLIDSVLVPSGDGNFIG
ncbi:hypothetical protein ACF0H5_021206 [Mactra antiquata]